MIIYTVEQKDGSGVKEFGPFSSENLAIKYAHTLMFSLQKIVSYYFIKDDEKNKWCHSELYREYYHKTIIKVVEKEVDIPKFLKEIEDATKEGLIFPTN